MPCFDPNAHDLSIAEEKINKLTRMLCSTLEVFTRKLPLSLLKIETRSWWEKHLQQDAERDRIAKREALRTHKRKLLRKRALNKLTEAERRALGVGDSILDA